MKTTFSLSLFLALFAVASADFSVKDRLTDFRKSQIEHSHQASLEAIALHDSKKAEHLEKLLTDRNQKLTDHHTGRHLLQEEEHLKVQRQVVAFERKLKQIKESTDKERMERVEEMRTHHNELRMDYLDFDKVDV